LLAYCNAERLPIGLDRSYNFTNIFMDFLKIFLFLFEKSKHVIPFHPERS